ncbi:MAG: hypothetical protein ACE5I9_05465 [Candidatus Methylomirabilales bacterium]
MDEEWTDAEIRALRERIAMERRRAELRALGKRKPPRRLVRKRPLPGEVSAAAGGVAKKRRLAG